MTKKYPFKQKILILETVKSILRTIKANKGIEIGKLLSIMHVNEPFINKKAGLEYLKDMEKSGKIKVNKVTKEVEICQ